MKYIAINMVIPYNCQGIAGSKYDFIYIQKVIQIALRSYWKHTGIGFDSKYTFGDLNAFKLVNISPNKWEDFFFIPLLRFIMQPSFFSQIFSQLSRANLWSFIQTCPMPFNSRSSCIQTLLLLKRYENYNYSEWRTQIIWLWFCSKCQHGMVYFLISCYLWKNL